MARALQQYIDKLEDLPPTMKKTSEDIKELDKKTNQLMREIKLKAYAMVSSQKRYNREQKCKTYREVEALLKEAEELSRRKVQLAEKQYDMIDDRVKMMDNEMNNFYDEQRRNHMHETQRVKNLGAAGGAQSPKGRKRKLEKRKDKKGDAKQARLAQTAAIMENFNPLPISPVVEMPIDPNEPTYCLCHQVSFGNMIACESPTCKIEWFHFQCVGLTESPTGHWYCSDCQANMKKKKK